MKEQSHSTAVEASLPREKKEIVSIEVEEKHPLLQLKRALPWAEIEEVMIRHWRSSGKNVDGGVGKKWDVKLYVAILVLMLVKQYHSREMEEYLAQNVVARVFINRQQDSTAQIRDHSNIARALEALGEEGQEEVNSIVVKKAAALGFADPRILSADTTVQELPIGYPNEPGILRGIAERCSRAVLRLKKEGMRKTATAIEKAKEVIRSVKEYHLFAKTKEQKQKILKRIIKQTKELIGQSMELASRVKTRADQVKLSARNKLISMKEVATQLIPQIKYWMKTGRVASGKILHAGITQARSIVRTAGQVKFGLKYLINRIGGGYLIGKLILNGPHETKMPLEALSCYRKVFGIQAKPEMIVYDRGGHAKATVKKLVKEGIKKIGIQPKGKAPWLVAERDRQTVKSERGKTEGSIGTLKSDKYGFNLPKERNWRALQASGQRSILSLNLNTLLKDVSNQKRSGRAKAA